ncbi:MAG: hypothetical protein ACT4TC_06940 [Myxococcaceae bacterium]
MRRFLLPVGLIVTLLGSTGCAFWKMYTRSPYAESFSSNATTGRKQVEEAAAGYAAAESRLQGGLRGVTAEMKATPEYASFEGKYEAIRTTVAGYPEKQQKLDVWVAQINETGQASVEDLTRVSSDHASIMRSYSEASSNLSLLGAELERLQSTVRSQKMQQDAIKQFKRTAGN